MKPQIQAGELPAGLILPPRENDYHPWNEKAKAWVLTKEDQAQLLAEAVGRGVAAINDMVDGAYRHVTRFQPEYELREQQARKYKAGGCARQLALVAQRPCRHCAHSIQGGGIKIPATGAGIRNK